MGAKDPLHGKTLEMILTELVEHFGWEDLGSVIDIRCFRFDPSIKSSLTFLRKTPWARKKVEELYISIQRDWIASLTIVCWLLNIECSCLNKHSTLNKTISNAHLLVNPARVCYPSVTPTKASEQASSTKESDAASVCFHEFEIWPALPAAPLLVFFTNKCTHVKSSNRHLI